MAYVDNDGVLRDDLGYEYKGDGLEELDDKTARELVESLALEAALNNDQEKMDMANCVAKQYG